MLVKIVPPLFALGMLVFAGIHVLRSQPERPVALPPIAPATPSFSTGLAASAVVEANTGNLALAAAVPGIVDTVFVTVGQEVAAQAPLFRLDDRPLCAEQQVRQARLATAKAQLARLEQLPRVDELPVSAARVREAKAAVAERGAAFERGRRLFDENLLDNDELERRKQGLEITREQLSRAEAEAALVRAGAWQPDKTIASAQVAEAKALLSQVQIDLDRLTVRAPVAGTVLQVNVRPGEAVAPLPDAHPVVLGNLHPLHVRVDLDEQQLSRFRPDAPARAVRRGQAQPVFTLKFVRVEPLVVTKRLFVGESADRADTRVLPVLYALEPGAESVHVGQQLDVFIASEKTAVTEP